MKKHRKSLLFCLTFGLICVLPLLGMLALGPSAAGSNEVLAGAPQLVKKNGDWNTAYLSDLGAYVRDRFGFRRELIAANAHLTQALFGESATEQVILGADGWLYYADTLADYEGSAPMSQRAIWNAARSLALMEEYANEHGAAFVFAAVPNKNTLYPQGMPRRYRPAEAASNLQRLQTALAEAQVTYCDLAGHLASQPEPVYYKTDSHWTGYGSALAHDALLATLGRTSGLAEEAFVMTDHRGDLTDMLYAVSGGTEPGLTLARQRAFTYAAPIRDVDDMVIRTESAAAGSLLMFRDSFGNTLHLDLAESFGRSCFSRAMPYDLTMLTAEGADTLMVELVERNLADLAEKAPIMEAPIRTAEISGQAGAAVVETGKSKLEGFLKYTGTVSCPDMDLTSPIYVRIDGVTYEATPAGHGDYGFTLHAPAGTDIQVLVQCQGLWMACQ